MYAKLSGVAKRYSHWTRKTLSKRKSKTRVPISAITIPHVVGEGRSAELTYPKARVRVFADENKKRYTAAERGFELFLRAHRDGALRRRYVKQHPVSGKWIVDFYFPEVRLAVEIDGSYHRLEWQRHRDRQKDADCASFDITLIRVTNSEVWGDRNRLIRKLRAGWIRAKSRKNRIIGTPVS